MRRKRAELTFRGHDAGDSAEADHVSEPGSERTKVWPRAFPNSSRRDPVPLAGVPRIGTVKDGIIVICFSRQPHSFAVPGTWSS